MLYCPFSLFPSSCSFPMAKREWMFQTSAFKGKMEWRWKEFLRCIYKMKGVRNNKVSTRVCCKITSSMLMVEVENITLRRSFLFYFRVMEKMWISGQKRSHIQGRTIIEQAYMASWIQLDLSTGVITALYMDKFKCILECSKSEYLMDVFKAETTIHRLLLLHIWVFRIDTVILNYVLRCTAGQKRRLLVLRFGTEMSILL